MKVFNTSNNVIVNADNAVEIERLISEGAEEIDIRIFGDYAHLADNTNTTLSGSWRFDFDEEAYKSQQQEEDNLARALEIQERLTQIDLDSVRPLRAINNNASTEYDYAKIATLDSEAAELRLELAQL